MIRKTFVEHQSGFTLGVVMFSVKTWYIIRDISEYLFHFAPRFAPTKYVSLMLKQGIHRKIAQERLGHPSISITLNTYSHVVPRLQEAAAKKFDELSGIKDNGIVSQPNQKREQHVQ